MNKPGQINFDYNGKHYTLEYTRASVKAMEAAGFNPSDIYEKPATRLEQMWAGAFLANHRNVSNTVIEKLYDEMDDKKALFETLQTMVGETYDSLLPDTEEDAEGKVKWTAN